MIRSRVSPPEFDSNDPPFDETALIERARTDRKAFEPIYNLYRGQMLRYCERRLGSRELADDATQMIFEKVLLGLPGFRGGVFRAWIFTIANNVIRDHYRSAHDLEPIDDHDDLHDPGPDPERLAILADDHRLLLAALPMLTLDQRRVVELKMSGLSASEVGAILGRSEEAVRKLLQRAVERLQVILRVTEEKGGAR